MWMVILRFGQSSKSSGSLITNYIPGTAQTYSIIQAEFLGQGPGNSCFKQDFEMNLSQGDLVATAQKGKTISFLNSRA